MNIPNANSFGSVFLNLVEILDFLTSQNNVIYTDTNEIMLIDTIDEICN